MLGMAAEVTADQKFDKRKPLAAMNKTTVSNMPPNIEIYKFIVTPVSAG